MGVLTGTGQEDQQAAVTELHRAHGPAVSGDSGGAESGQLGERDLMLGGAEGVGSREPARAHHQRDVVVDSAGAFTQGLGSLSGQFLSSHLPYITTVDPGRTGGDSLGGSARLIR